MGKGKNKFPPSKKIGRPGTPQGLTLGMKSLKVRTGWKPPQLVKRPPNNKASLLQSLLPGFKFRPIPH